MEAPDQHLEHHESECSSRRTSGATFADELQSEERSAHSLDDPQKEGKEDYQS